jgi:hypothetical protein
MILEGREGHILEKITLNQVIIRLFNCLDQSAQFLTITSLAQNPILFHYTLDDHGFPPEMDKTGNPKSPLASGVLLDQRL